MWKIVLFVLALSFLVLMVMLRSLLLPLKAVLMNLLSIGAAFGVLVAIFQWGWFDSLLGFESQGALDTINVPLIFAIVFGLSMDYEVFLMSRIRERYAVHGDNERAVAEGLSSSARTISSAALIMTAVFAVFVLTGVPSIKELGLGCAVAIALDATLVRLILVPAAMKLLGDWNWWMPSWLDRVLPGLASGRPRRAEARWGLSPKPPPPDAEARPSPYRFLLGRQARARIFDIYSAGEQACRSPGSAADGSARGSRSSKPGVRAGPAARARRSSQRLRYAFDNTMARGTPALVGWLALVTLALIGLFTAVVLISDLAPANRPGPTGVVGQAFENLLHALDPGTIAGDAGSTGRSCWRCCGHPGRPVRRQRPDRRDRQPASTRGSTSCARAARVVLEKDHTLILGWSDVDLHHALRA